MGKHIFGYNPNEKEYDISHLAYFLQQFEQPQTFTHTPNNNESLIVQELTSLQTETEQNEFLKEANEVQNKMFEKQGWYILEHLTMGTLNYLDIKNQKSSGVQLTADRLEALINKYRGEATDEEIDKIVMEATEKENVPLVETTLNQDKVEEMARYNVEGDYKKDEEKLFEAKKEQLIKHFEFDKDNIKEMFTPAVDSGDEAAFKQQYANYIRNRMNALPIDQRTPEAFNAECNRLNLGIKLCMPDENITKDHIDNMYYGTMNSKEYKDLGQSLITPQTDVALAKQNYKDILGDIKNGNINKEQAIDKFCNMMSDFKGRHATRGLGTRFADWFRSGGVNNISNLMLKDFSQRMGLNQKDLANKIANVKAEGPFDKYAEHNVDNKFLDFSAGGLDKEIAKVPAVDLNKVKEEPTENKDEISKDWVEINNNLEEVKPAVEMSEINPEEQQILQEKLANDLQEKLPDNVENAQEMVEMKEMSINDPEIEEELEDYK